MLEFYPDSSKVGRISLKFCIKRKKDGSGETSHEAADTVQVRDAGKLL